MLTVDTSALVAASFRSDPHHDEAAAGLNAEPGSVVVPVAILAEIAYMLERRGGTAALTGLLDEIEAGSLIADCGEDDLPRIRALMDRYADLALGFADASVIACAERYGGRVLTFDRRDFAVVAREGTITIVP